MSVVSFALAVVFIIRLFSTSAFRVPKSTQLNSKHAGNTGLRNEIVSICDEILRQKILSRDAYKNLMLTLNKDVNY